MFTIHLPEATEDDKLLMAAEIHLEHSLVSLSKWEAIHERAFFKPNTKMTDLEIASYIEQMLVGKSAPNWLNRIPVETYEEIANYINSKQTATWFRETPGPKGTPEIITSELIYYWMIGFQIPFDPCQNWHVNRLMTLIKICGIKQTKPKPMSRQEQAEQYKRLNEERRRQLNTSG